MKVAVFVGLLCVVVCSAQTVLPTHPLLPTTGLWQFVNTTNLINEYDGLFSVYTKTFAGTYLEIVMFPAPIDYSDTADALDVWIKVTGTNSSYSDLTSTFYSVRQTVTWANVSTDAVINVEAVAWVTGNSGFYIRACVGGCEYTCPSDCNNNGYCNINTKTCTCGTAWEGDSCGKCPACDKFLGIFIGSIALTIFLILVLPILVCCCCIAVGVFLCCRKRSHHHHHYAPVPAHHHH